MDFPPLDDARWDRLLRAVVGQRPTVGDPTTPLAALFPAASIDRGGPGRDRRSDGRTRDGGTIRLDSYA